MMRGKLGNALIVVIALLAMLLWWSPEPPEPPVPVGGDPSPTAAEVGRPVGESPLPPHRTGLPAFLPPEASRTIRLILDNGPYPYRQDGTVFQNREKLLPNRPRGYYREFTVPTPGARDRGARRIVTGGDPPEVYYYTGDHYRSFRQFEVHR